MPKVSVIIPNYNHAQYLKQRIDSVLKQTYQDFEIIILDDCSPDNSREVIESYRSNQKVSHIVFNEVNSGTTFKQWEKGISLAIGSYIWIAESDDWCEPTLLENIMNGLLSNLNCTVGFCQSICTDGSNILWYFDAPKLEENINGKTFVRTQMIKRNAIFNASMVVWRKDAYFNIAKSFTKFKFCGDWLFWIELCLQGDVFVSGKFLNYFRKHSQDVSGKAYKTGYNFLEEIQLADIVLNDDKISYDQYLIFLKSRYQLFKEISNNLDSQTRGAIESKFFKTKKIAKFIKYNDNHIGVKILRKLPWLFNRCGLS